MIEEDSPEGLGHLEMSSRGVGLFLELRKVLRTGLIIVGRDVAGSPPEVHVTGGDSSLYVRTPRGLLHLELPPGVSLEEGSCLQTSAGQFHKEELHFRMRIDVDRQTDEEASAGVMERLCPKESYCFHCQACQTRLLEDRVFRRVLPLPNGNWNTIVDEWCCHPDPFANKELLPRAEDCLLGDTFLLVATDGGCEDTLTQELSSVSAEDAQDPKKPCRRQMIVSCKSCSSVLGEAVTPATLKLYITEVVVESSVGDSGTEASLNRSLFLERTIAARLRELSSTQSTFHFSIQTPDEKAFILLWVLNCDSIIASLPDEAVSGEEPTSPSLSLSSSSSLSPHSPSHRAASALKVLYIACGERGVIEREVVTSWEDNAIGHPLVLPVKTCEELLQVLDDSNSSLPPSLRCMRSYEVAYLRL